MTSAMALQSRMGAAGAQQFLAQRGAAAPAKAPSAPEPVNDKRAAEPHKTKPAHGKAAHGKAHPSEAGEEKVKAGARPEEEAPGGAAGAAAAPIKLHMPEPPTKPSKATMHRIAGVKTRAGGKAKAQGTLPAADKQVGDARKEVTPPEDERIAQAREDLIKELHPAPSPEILELCEKIRKVIREKRPPDEDALVKAEPDKEAMEAGNTLNSSVESQNKAVTTNYAPMENPPGPAAATPGPPAPPQPAAASTPAINAKAAVPDPVSPQSVSLDKDAAETRKKADDAGMNKPAAALVQSGPIAEAREAQGDLDQAAKEDPAKVLAKQNEALAKADQDMTALQNRALQALMQARSGTAGKNTHHQKGMVGSEEQQRTAAGNEAKEVFKQAQSDVRAQLKDLVPTAMADWEAAKARITSQFKADLKVVEDRVKERHSGWGWGTVLSIKDRIAGLPDWATDAYNDAEEVFSESVIRVLKRISAHVDLVIKTCEGIIKAARERIKKIFGDLSPALQKWASEEQAKFDKDLDKLGEEVVAERNSFNKQLTDSAAQAVDEVRAEISELRKKAGGLVGRIIDAVKRFVDDPAKFIIEGLLELLGISPPAFWAVVAKIKKVINDIIDDPIGFANNLLKGIGQGFSQFFDNFPTHMIKGFLSWLLGDLKDVQVPKDFSLKSIITFFLQIMGITWPNIRKILAEKIGEKNVALIEKVYSLISMLIEKGPEGIYEMIKEKLNPQAILDQVIDMAVDYMVTAIVKAVAARLILMFNPAGAILQAIEAIYKVLKWVFENAARIFTLIETIVNGLADIIAGNVGGFANAVEKGLAMLIPPVLGFIADYLGFGDLPKAVAKQIKGFRAWILGKISEGFDWLIAKGKALLAAVGIGKKEEDKKGKGGEQSQVGEEIDFEAGGESHRVWIQVSGKTANVMIASEPQGVSQFLNSKSVQSAKTDPKVSGLVATAESLLKTVNMTAEQLVNQMEAVKDQASTAPTQAQSNKVMTDERKLAETLHSLLQLLIAKPEPVAGLHGYLKQVSKKDVQDSHHVPAKALGSAIAGTLLDLAPGLNKPPWSANKAAVKLASAMTSRANTLKTLAAPPGDRLSAISLSHETHRGDFGIHSTGSAELLAKLADAPSQNALVVARRTTESELKTAGFVSVNPQTGAWRVFLADVRMRLDNAKYRTKSGEARGDVEAAELIVKNAEREFLDAEELDTEFIRDNFVTSVNEVLTSAPQYAYDAGEAVVTQAMDKTGEGSEAGRARALQDLKASYDSSWEPFRQGFQV